MEFKATSKFSLDFLGEGWENCYIEFKALTIRDMSDSLMEIASMAQENRSKEVLDKVLMLLQEKFVAGRGVGAKGIVDLAKDDLKELPIKALNKLIAFLTGEMNPNG